MRVGARWAGRWNARRLRRRSSRSSRGRRRTIARSRSAGVVQWTADRGSSEAFAASPIVRRGKTAGILLAGTSLREQIALERTILWIGVVVSASGIAIGVLLGWWTTERITRPVEKL